MINNDSSQETVGFSDLGEGSLGEEMTSFEKVVEKGINLALRTIKERYDGKLAYHNSTHTKKVIERVERILKAAGISNNEAIFHLARLAAAFHDLVLEYEIDESRTSKDFPFKLKRRKDNNEEESANALLEFMNLHPKFFDEEDKIMVHEAILGTEPHFTAERGVIQETFNQSGPIGIIARVLALADLGSCGMEEPEDSFKDAVNVFLEQFYVKLDDTPITLRDILDNEKLKNFFVDFIRGQKDFINKRKDRLDEEIGNFGEGVRELFSNFDGAVEFVQLRLGEFEKTILIILNFRKKSMKKILIIGASSYIGAKVFADFKKDFLVFGSYCQNKIFSSLIELNLNNKTQLKKVILKINPKIIIHFANYSDSDWCEKKQEKSLFVELSRY